MQWISELADETGLSLHQLAGLLGMSNSHLYMAMQGQRDWPAPALQQLLAMRQQLQQQGAAVAGLRLSATELQEARQQLYKLAYKVARAERSYQQLQQRQRSLLMQQGLLSAQLAAADSLPTGQRLRLQLQLDQCQQRLQRCSTWVLLQEGLKLAGWQQQLATLQQALQAYEAPE